MPALLIPRKKLTINGHIKIPRKLLSIPFKRAADSFPLAIPVSTTQEEMVVGMQAKIMVPMANGSAIANSGQSLSMISVTRGIIKKQKPWIRSCIEILLSEERKERLWMIKPLKKKMVATPSLATICPQEALWVSPASLAR